MFPEALNTNNLKWKCNFNDDLKKLLRYFNLGLSADDLWYKISKKQQQQQQQQKQQIIPLKTFHLDIMILSTSFAFLSNVSSLKITERVSKSWCFQ